MRGIQWTRRVQLSSSLHISPTGYLRCAKESGQLAVGRGGWEREDVRDSAAHCVGRAGNGGGWGEEQREEWGEGEATGRD